MLSLTSFQLGAWLANLVFPLGRMLGLMAAAPVFGERGIPIAIRLALGLAITVAVAPALPASEALPLDGWLAVTALVREIVVGAAMGFTLRLVFAAVDLAGELIGLQMGFSFASFYDPQTSGQTAVVAQFLGLLAILVFLGLDGHLMLIEVAARSFAWLPVGTAPPASGGWGFVAQYAVTVFAAGLLLALPLVATLLVAHFTVAALSRAAPQFNLLTVGFSVTVGTGLVVLPLTLQAFAPALHKLVEQGLEAVGQLVRMLAAA